VPGVDSGSLTVDLDGGDDAPAAPSSGAAADGHVDRAALLDLCTSFTRIVIVLSLTRNALGVQAIPPNQVIVGLVAVPQPVHHGPDARAR
jgi:flagellar biosynthetic protein FliP